MRANVSALVIGLSTSGVTIMSLNSERPVGARVLLAVADPVDDPCPLKRLELADHDRPGAPTGLNKFAGACSTSLADEPDKATSAGGKARLSFPIHGDRGEGQPHTARGLPVIGISQASEPHLFKHASDALAKFLAEVKVGTDAGDTRIPC